jgi:cytochrome P450
MAGNAVTGLLRFGASPLGFLDGLRADERPIVPFALGTVRGHLLTRPEDIEAVLASEDWPPLTRGRLAAIDNWYSGPLILTHGREHRARRDDLWRPLLADTEAVLHTAVERTDDWVDALADGGRIDLFRELRALCWSVDWRALTGSAFTPDLVAAQERGVAAMVWLLGPFGRSRWDWPAPTSARARAARRRIDAAIDAEIARRRGGDAANGLLSRLLELADDDLARTSVKEWLGANQLGSHLTWTLALLAASPEVEQRFHAELDDVLGDRPPTPADVASLRLTWAISRESLRLYPPIWGFFRGLDGDFAVGGETIRAGHVLALSQWFTHRDPRLWHDPGRFDPDRWFETTPRGGAYFPYSDGPYGCPAHSVSSQQAVLMLAALGRRASFRPVGGLPKPAATGAIVPRNGVATHERRTRTAATVGAD